MKQALKLSVALGFTCALAAGVLTYANTKTKPAQQRAEMVQREDALKSVLPAFDNSPLEDAATFTDEVSGQTFTFYRARSGSKLVAVAGEGSSPKGYGGNVNVLLGLDGQGAVRTVVVTGHKETPGLGTQATDRKQLRSIWSLFACSKKQSGCGACTASAAPVLPPNAYLDQYAAKQFTAADAPFKVVQDGGKIDAISGATVSSRAVADAVSRICTAFQAHKSEILSAN